MRGCRGYIHSANLFHSANLWSALASLRTPKTRPVRKRENGNSLHATWILKVLLRGTAPAAGDPTPSQPENIASDCELLFLRLLGLAIPQFDLDIHPR